MKKTLLVILSLSLLTGCHPSVLSEQEVNDKVHTCLKKNQKPWYTFVKQGDKKSGVIFIECKDKNYPPDLSKKESSLFDDDDTPVSATGQPSLSGLPGGPF